jgi:hypothetical protein
MLVRLSAATAILCLALPALAGAQGGYDTDPTREQWVAEAESLCKDANPRSHKLIDKFIRNARRGHPVVAGRTLITLARHLLELIDEVSAIERPPADAGRIDRWLGVETRSNRVAIKSGRAAMKEKIGRANALFNRSARLGHKGERISRVFDFEHC